MRGDRDVRFAGGVDKDRTGCSRGRGGCHCKSIVDGFGGLV